MKKDPNEGQCKNETDCYETADLLKLIHKFGSGLSV